MNQAETHRLIGWWLRDRGFDAVIKKTLIRFEDDELLDTMIEIRVQSSKRVELRKYDQHGNLIDYFQGDNWVINSQGLAIGNEKGEIEWILPKRASTNC